jgi:outer membrane receptor protein involved in Fe transport
MGAMSRKPGAAALALLLGTSLHARSASDEEELALLYGDKATISIATGAQQPLRRAPAVATVITAQDIAAMGVVGLDEVMESVPGIHVGRSHIVYSPLYLIRGIHSDFNPQTLMLQNGVPMTTLFVGNRGNGWGGLPVENIARIEVIRGPGSALYGADAYSGVINIITKTAEDTPGTEFGARAGSFQSRGAWVQHGGRLGPATAAAYLSAGHTDGHKEVVQADAQTRLDTLLGTRASLAPGPVNTGYDAVDGHLDLGWQKLRLHAGYKLRDHVGAGAGVAAALDPLGETRTERVHTDLSWSDIDLAPHWRMTLTGSLLHYSQKIKPLQLFPPGASFGGANTFPAGMFGAPNTWERQTRLSAVAAYTGWRSHNLRLGVGHDDLDLYRTQEFKNFTFSATGTPVPNPGGQLTEASASQIFMTPQRRTVDYLYVQDEWSFARDWTLTGGVRHDRYSDFGGTTNPRLAMVWDASLDLTAKLLYGRAFRAPAFTEQYSLNNPVNRGNEDLSPETIRTLEAAFAWQARADTQVNLSLFRYRMKDIIRTSPAGGGTVMFNNVGAQRGHGLELEGIWTPVRQLRAAGYYAYQRSIDERSNRDAGYAPHHHLFARADWSFPNAWQLGGQVNHVAGRRRAAGDVRPDRVPDFTTADVTLRTRRTRGQWDFSLSVRNLFNADVREPSLAPGVNLPGDIPMPRRTWYLQAAFQL